MGKPNKYQKTSKQLWRSLNKLFNKAPKCTFKVSDKIMFWVYIILILLIIICAVMITS